MRPLGNQGAHLFVAGLPIYPFIYLKPVMDPQLQTNAKELRGRIAQIVGHL